MFREPFWRSLFRDEVCATIDCQDGFDKELVVDGQDPRNRFRRTRSTARSRPWLHQGSIIIIGSRLISETPFIGDTTISSEIPDIFIGDSRFLLETSDYFIGEPIFSLETLKFCWRPQVFHRRPKFLFIGDLQISIGDPKIFIEDRRYWLETLNLLYPMKIYGSPIKIWCLK